jgi:hypothetical protein
MNACQGTDLCGLNMNLVSSTYIVGPVYKQQVTSSLCCVTDDILRNALNMSVFKFAVIWYCCNSQMYMYMSWSFKINAILKIGQCDYLQ